MGKLPYSELETTYGNEYSNDNGRFKLRWYVTAERTGVREVTFRRYLQLLVTKDSLLYGMPTRVYQFTKGDSSHGSRSWYQATHYMTSGGGKEPAEGFTVLNQWKTLYIEQSSDYNDEIVNGALEKRVGISDYIYAPAYAEYDNYYNEYVRIVPEYYESRVGGTDHRVVVSYEPTVMYPRDISNRIDYSYPSSENVKFLNVTDSSFDVQFICNSPYDATVTVTAEANGTTTSQTFEQEWSAVPSTSNVSFSNLLPNTYYNVKIRIVIQGTNVSATNSTYQRTLPRLVSEIDCANNLYVNENESITLTPTVRPNDATSKTLMFTRQSDLYALSEVGSSRERDSVGWASSVKITGKEPSSASADLLIESQSGGATKAVNIYVCRPATVIVPVEVNKKVAENASYQITYNVYPEGTTDSNMTFTSSDSSVATVSSDGVVTGVSKGEATITLSLATRIIDQYGTATQGTPITAQVNITVSDVSSWVELDEDPVYLSSEYIDNAFNNLSILRVALDGYTYTKSGQTYTVSIPSLDTPPTNGRVTPVYDVVTCLNAIESSMDKMYTATHDLQFNGHPLATAELANANSIYLYDEEGHQIAPVTWGGVVESPSSYITRWWSYLSELKYACDLAGLL